MNHLDQQCSAIRDRLRRRGGSSGVARSAARSCPLRRRLPAEAPAGSGRWAAMPPAVGCDYHLNRQCYIYRMVSPHLNHCGTLHETDFFGSSPPQCINLHERQTRASLVRLISLMRHVKVPNVPWYKLHYAHVHDGNAPVPMAHTQRLEFRARQK